MLNQPKVSVIIHTYNRANMLREAIGSVLNQTLKDFELIIINDGEKKDTRCIISKFKDPRLRYFEKENTDSPAVWNFGVHRIKGRYVSYLDDDDIYYPNHLKVLSGFLDRHPDIGLVYGKVHFKMRNRVFQPYSFDYSKNRLEIDNFIPSNSLMHRKDCIQRVGFFDENIHYGADWDMWLRISDKYKIFPLKEFVAQVRFHKENLTYKTEDHSKWYIYIIKKRILKSQAKKKPAFDSYYVAVAYRLIYKFKTPKGLFIKFMKELAKSDKKNPSIYLSLCLGYLAYRDFDNTIRMGKYALSLLPKRRMSAFESECAFNIHRILAFIFRRENRPHQEFYELKSALELSRWKNKRADSLTELRSLVSRFLRRF